LLSFCLDGLCVVDNGVLKSSTIIVLSSLCTFKSNRICSKKLGETTLGTYNLTIIISF
jgi:hypothetical protein